MSPAMKALALGLVGLLIVSRLISYILGRRFGRLPPGPKPLPVIGNRHQVPNELTFLKFHQWSKIYGPVMHLNMAGKPVVILSTVEAASDLLSKRSALYSDRPHFIVAAAATHGFHLLLRQNDARYKLHQRIAAPLLNPRASKQYQSVQERESRQMLHNILAEADKNGERGTDPMSEFLRTTGSVIYSCIYGYRFDTGQDETLLSARKIQDSIKFTAQLGRYIVDSLPILDSLPRTLAPWKREAEAMWDLEINLHLSNLEKGLANPGWNFAKHMVDASEAKKMSKDELAYGLGNISDAGLDTSAITLQWFVVACITQGDRFVDKARKVLDEVVGRERMPTFEDREDLVYIEAIVNEVTRWRPILPGGFPHVINKEDVYQGYRIPAGSLVIANHWAVSRDESVFGDEIDDFVPERWLTIDESVGEKDNPAHKLKLRDNLPLPGFGYGRRICTGRNIARNSLFINIARLLWAFDVEMPVADTDLSTPSSSLSEKRPRQEIDDMVFEEGFVAGPKHLCAIFKPRGGWVRDIIEREGCTDGEDLGSLLDKVGRERVIRV